MFAYKSSMLLWVSLLAIISSVSEASQCQIDLDQTRVAYSLGAPIVTPTMYLDIDFSFSESLHLGSRLQNSKTAFVTHHLKTIEFSLNTLFIELNGKSIACAVERESCKKIIEEARYWLKKAESNRFSEDKQELQYIACARKSVLQFERMLDERTATSFRSSTPATQRAD